MATLKEKHAKFTAEVERSRRWREDQGFDAAWREMYDLYAGKNIFPDGASTEDRIAINQAFATINVIYPSVSVNNPKINVLATHPENEDRAVFNEAILNYFWNHYGFHAPFRTATKDFLIIGHGWTKTMWLFEEEERPMSEEEFAVRFAERLAMANERGEEVDDTEVAKQVISSSVTVKHDRPVVERVSPFDMFVNPEATTLEDARWIAQRVVRHVDDVKSDDAYSRAERSKVSAGLTEQSYAGSDPHRGDVHDSMLCEVWEFYDLVEGEMCVFADKSAGFLVKPRKMPYAFGHPFEMARNYEVPGHFYPIGDLEQIVPLVKELSKTRSEMMNHRAKYARKYVARASALKKGDERKLASKRDGEVLFVEDDSRPLTDVVVPVPQIPMDSGLYAWSDTISDDIQALSGVTDYAQGGGGNIRRTATEAALIQDATNARAADKLSIVEGFISNIARKVLQVSQQFLTGSQVARIVGREGQMVWLPYDRSDIIGEYDFTVEGGSTQPTNESTRRQNAMGLAQVMMPFIQLGVVNVQELLRHMLREGFSIRNPEKFMAQTPSPGFVDANGAGGGGVGADAPQPTPEQRREANQAAEDEAIGGVPNAQFNQLSGQVGVN